MWLVKHFSHILWYIFFMEQFNEKLRQLRIENNLSQSEVANKLGLTRNAIGNYETGIREPSIEILKKICDLFDVSADYLIGRTDSY